eukprot:COSAG05_NODE_1426_length_4919_cov_280.452075_5_plen_200_part_00
MALTAPYKAVGHGVSVRGQWGKRGGGKFWGSGGCQDNQFSRQRAAWRSRQRRSFSRRRRPKIARTTRPTPVHLRRRLAGHPAPGRHHHSRTQATTAVPRRPSQLPVEAALAWSLGCAPPGVRRRMLPNCPWSPRRWCTQGCRRRRRGRWARTRPVARKRVSKSSQRWELAAEMRLCKEGGLTVEQGGAGPVVASGSAVR